MDAHEPTILSDRDNDGSLNGGGGNSAALDATILPEEFPDDRPWASRDYGTTEAEQARPEGLNGRLRREEPDSSAEIDDDNGDDEGDFEDESPELLSVLNDEGEDIVKELTTMRARSDRHTDDSGQPISPRSAEEDAIHVVDQESELAED